MSSNDSKTRGGSGHLPAQAVLLLSVHALFAVANALSGTFVNVYLWKVGNDLSLIGWFQLSHHTANALTFWLAGKWVKEFNKMNSLRLGIGVSAFFYLLVLMLQKKAVDYVVPLGAVQGIAAGFFWLAFNVVYFEITDPDNRDKFNGWSGLLGSGAGMIAPWVSGLIITHMEDTSGYRVIFTLSLTVFVIANVLSFFLKKRKIRCKYEWTLAFRKWRQRGNIWRKALPALTFQGIREGVFAFVIGLLVYIATGSEMKLGNYALITSLVALFSFMVVGKYLKPAYRARAMLYGSIAMTLVIVPFFIDIHYGMLLVFGIGTSLFVPLYTIPMTSTVFDLIGKDQESADLRVEYVVLRELGLNAGRMVGTAAFIAVVSLTMNELAHTLFILLVGSMPVIGSLFMRPVLANVQTRFPSN